MSCQFYFITHPNVLISKDVPVNAAPTSKAKFEP